MKIRLPFIAFLITLLTANPVSAHTSAAHPHSWYALDHIIIALGIAFSVFLLFKIVFFFFKKTNSRKALNRQDTLKKTSVNK